MAQVRSSKNWFNKLHFLALAFLALGLSVFVVKTSNTFCANSISCIKDLTGKFDVSSKIAEFEGKNVAVPGAVADSNIGKNVLGEVPAANKRIEVNLTTQTLTAFQNDQPVMSFPVSTGKWHLTPTGTFYIWVKLRYTRMAGGSKALHTYYNLPNVPYVMFFYNDKVSKYQGYSLHGAYWHNNFGHPMSHGCVNISPENAEKLYYWADPPSVKSTTYATPDNPGTRVDIFGTTPTN